MLMLHMSLISCQDKRSECKMWKNAGECDKNPEYMHSYCAYQCNTCEDNRCVRSKHFKTLQSGDIDAILENIPKNWSSYYEIEKIHTYPIILRIKNFLSNSDIRGIFEYIPEFQRSLAGEGINPVRTSSTSWCNTKKCMKAPLMQFLHKRMSNMTNLPMKNAEHLQVLRYKENEFYKEHHDQNAPSTSPWGPRIFTFFVYLSDVEKGGQTRFTTINKTIQPIKGSAILWPSVKSENPFEVDYRTKHEALTVEKGIKYSANFWFHLYDFRTFHSRGCSN